MIRTNRLTASGAAKNLLKGAGFSFLFFLGFEVLARVAESVWSDVFGPKDWFTYSSTAGWERRPSFSGRLFDAERSFDERGLLSVDARKLSGSNKPLVVFLGDSNTFGNGVPLERTFVELVQQQIGGINFVNLSVPGYTSYQGYQILLRDVIPLKPRAAVLAFNFNDRRYMFSPQETDSAERFARLGRSSWHLVLKRVALYRVMLHGFRKIPLLREILLRRAPQQVDIRLLVPRVPPDMFAYNLQQMAAELKKNGATPIILLFGDNPVQSREARLGARLLERGRLTQAAARLKTGVLLNNAFSIVARKHLAQAYGRLNRADRAESVLSITQPIDQLHGGQPLFLSSEYNRIALKVARKNSLPVINAYSVLNRTPAVYTDYCHFNELGHSKVANLIVRSFRRHKLFETER